MGAVIINKTKGISGRVPAGFDFYTGLCLYGTAPSVTGKWAPYTGTPSIVYQQMFSIADATSAGIIPFSENTASTSTLVISTKGNTGDTLNPVATIPVSISSTYPAGTKSISLGTYTVGAGDTTIALQGAALAAVINAGTYIHGFSASFTTATLTITAPKSCGVSLNTGTIYSYNLNSGTGFVLGTITQNVISGTASQYAIWYYHINRYFVQNPTGNLWVSITASSTSFNELVTLQAAAGSKLRQIGIYDTDVTRGAAANIAATILSVQNAALLIDKTAPVSVFYSPNFAAVTDLSTYPDQNLNTANKVETILSQDGNQAGNLLYIVSGQTVGNIGDKLGTISSSRVSSSDAQPISDFNLAIDGVENNLPAFGNGKLLSQVSVGLRTQLDNYNYVFFRTFGDTVAGTYWTSNKCCIVNTSSYAYVNDNRVADKVSRILYSTLVPQLESELIFNANGTLTDFTIQSFITQGQSAITAGMITGYGNLPLISGNPVLTIDPTQKVKQTNNLVINCSIEENGIARNITVNLSYQ